MKNREDLFLRYLGDRGGDIAFETPNGDLYTLHWDHVAQHVVMILVHVGDKSQSNGALCVSPQSGNSIQLCPRRNRP